MRKWLSNPWVRTVLGGALAALVAQWLPGAVGRTATAIVGVVAAIVSWWWDALNTPAPVWLVILFGVAGALAVRHLLIAPAVGREPPTADEVAPAAPSMVPTAANPASPDGSTDTDWAEDKVLQAFVAADEDALPRESLPHRTGTNRVRVQHALDRLEGRGFVQQYRVKGPDIFGTAVVTDYVRLTPEGRAYLVQRGLA